MAHDHRARMTGRRGNKPERFAGIPIRCMESEHFIQLSSKAKVLLLELAMQFNGRNNGDLSITPKVLKPRGWRSNRALYAKRDELELGGWIVTTRIGGRNRCSLYALTFHPIDDCKGKHDVQPSSRTLDFWKMGRNPWAHAKNDPGDGQKSEHPPSRG